MIWLLVLIVIASCTLPEIKKIELTVGKKGLHDALKNIGDYEEGEIKPKYTAFKSHIAIVGHILLTSPAEDLTSNSQRYKHARNAVLLIVNSIEKHSDYDFFVAKFINRIQRVSITLIKAIV